MIEIFLLVLTLATLLFGIATLRRSHKGVQSLREGRPPSLRHVFLMSKIESYRSHLRDRGKLTEGAMAWFWENEFPKDADALSVRRKFEEAQ